MKPEEQNAKDNVEGALRKDDGTELDKVKSRKLELLKLWEEKGLVKEDLALNYADLEHDFAYVVDMNRFTAEKFQSVVDVFPNSEELDILINILQDDERKHRARLFKSVVVALEEQGVNPIIKKYEIKKDDNLPGKD